MKGSPRDNGKTHTIKKEEMNMKRFALALSVLSVLGLTACAATPGTWTPMSDGRTAGKPVVDNTVKAPAKTSKKKSKADTTFNKAMHK